MCLQTPYLQFIHELTCAFRTRPIVLLEGRHVSVCLSRQSLCSDDMATAVRDILQQHGWAQAAFIGHSYGTFVLSRIAQIHKPIIHSMVRSCPTPLPVSVFLCAPSLPGCFIKS